MTGSITKRPGAKGVYVLRLDLGRDEKGKRVRHVETFHGTRKQANTRLRVLLQAHDTGRWTEPSCQSLREYLTQWLEVAAKPTVSAKTLEGYQKLLSIYVHPKLGNLALNKLTPLAIQGLYRELADGGQNAAGRKGTWSPLASTSIRKVHVVLHRALKQAVRWRLLAYPPTADVEPPRLSRESKIRALSKAELDRFLAAAKEDRWATLWLLFVHSGCRPEELLGLLWDRVLWDHSAIQVDQVLVRPRVVGKGAKWSLEPPKTKRSKRLVTLPLPVMRALEKHRLKQNEEKAFFGAEYHDQGFVFAGQAGQPLQHNLIVLRHFKPCLEAAGLPKATRLYDLRHSHASVLLAHGEDAKTVSERLGHSSVAFTLDVYCHLVEDQQKGAARRLESLFFSESTG